MHRPTTPRTIPFTSRAATCLARGLGVFALLTLSILPVSAAAEDPAALVSADLSIDGPSLLTDRDAPPPAHRRFEKSGPRSSHWDPPPNDDRHFSTDAAPTLDAGCLFRSQGPITFDIRIDRHLGPLNPDGTLKYADEMIAAGLLGPVLFLQMPVFDVDDTEIDTVYWNGDLIGYLTGGNNLWKVNTFLVDIRKVRFAHRVGQGSTPTGIANQVRIDIDVASAPDETWCTEIDWGAVNFKTVSPILLVHGHGSSSNFWINHGFKEYLQKLGSWNTNPPPPTDLSLWPHEHLINLPTESVATNGQLLVNRIDPWVRSFGADSFHIVAHSKGGLDSREYIAKHLPADLQVLSFTTLATPHEGSVHADLLMTRDQAVATALDVEFQGFPTFTQTVLDQITTARGTEDLTPAAASLFNIRNKPWLPVTMRIHTVAGEPDLNGNGTIDRSNPDEYAALRLDDFSLQQLEANLGQWASKAAVNLVYDFLGTTADVTMTLEDRGPWWNRYQVAVVSRTLVPGFRDNDTLVVLDSARGTNSIAPRVTYHQDFLGADGREHSSISNHGVAATVVPWILEAEQLEGDLR